MAFKSSCNLTKFKMEKLKVQEIIAKTDYIVYNVMYKIKREISIMKKISKVFILLITVLFIFSLSACLGKNDDATPIISTTLSNFTMNLNGAKKLALTTYAELVNETSQKRNAFASDTLNVSNEQDENENALSTKKKNDESIVFVKVDESENIEEVVLSEDETDDDPAKTIDEYELEIYKMSVFGDFTAVSYISSYWRETQPDASQWTYNGTVIYNRLKVNINDNYSYQNNDVINSYLVHNSTGKIFSTEEITGSSGSFHTAQNYNGSDINDGFLHVCQKNCGNACNCEDKIWYDVSINANGELELKDLLPNKDFKVEHAVKDIYGWVYVANSGVEEVNEQKHIIYYNGNGYMDGENNKYKLASNGKVYLKSSDIIPQAVYSGYAAVMIDGEEKAVSRNDAFDSIRGDSGYMIDGVYYYNGTLAKGADKFTIGIDCVDKRVLEVSTKGLPTYTHETYGELTYLDNLYNIEDFYSAEYRVWTGRNQNTGKWELYYIRNSEYMFDEDTTLEIAECELLLSNFVETSSSKYRYAQVTSEGTTVYAIVMGDNGKPEAIEYSNSIFESKMITIQPLN